MVVPAAGAAAVVRALRAAHPYEEPAFDLLEQAPRSRRPRHRPGRASCRRRCRCTSSPGTQRRRCPATAWGVRAAGDPDRTVRTVAVCGGSGGAARRSTPGAPAPTRSSPPTCKHHHDVEAVTERGAAAMALVDAAHWATEAPWLDALAARLRRALRHYGGGPGVAPRHRPVDAARPVARLEPEHWSAVNADHAAQLRLLDLQAADTALAQLRAPPRHAARAGRRSPTARPSAASSHDELVDAETEHGDVAERAATAGERRRRGARPRRHATSSGCRPAACRPRS